MKRPPVLDPPRVTRRKRVLSSEELQLWESVAKQAKPLRKRPRVEKIAIEVVEETAVVVTRSAPPPKASPAPRKISAAPPSPPPLAPLGRRERSQLSRGRKEIDARLDLHGMTQTRAHRALSDFLHRAQADGMTFVLVITGKGKTGSESERGVLRRQVPQWLSLPEFRGVVVGFEEAHIGHGGGGALYVRVRRGR
ncbi:MAG: Smr/MutS family protein [Afipia sp.]|nr:Smr/MutS family protein [Afipia sp.]